jgi:hypothetical protein
MLLMKVNRGLHQNRNRTVFQKWKIHPRRMLEFPDLLRGATKHHRAL